MEVGRGWQIESELQLGRFLAGLGGPRCRREVSDLVGGLLDLVPQLQLPEDKLTTLMECAQVPFLPPCRCPSAITV